MAIYESGAYQVKPSAVGKVKRAIQAFLGYLQSSEPGTEMYLAWQRKDDPSQFIHLFRFHDAAARERHGQSQPVKTLESVYRPELVGGDVVFTEYDMVAGKFPVEREGGVDVGAILRDFYAAAVERDFTALRRYLRDDLVFVGLFETYRSADQYLEAFRGLLSITERLEVKTIVAQGNDAAIFFELQTRVPAQGTVLVAEWHHFVDARSLTLNRHLTGARTNRCLLVRRRLDLNRLDKATICSLRKSIHNEVAERKRSCMKSATDKWSGNSLESLKMSIMSTASIIYLMRTLPIISVRPSRYLQVSRASNRWVV